MLLEVFRNRRIAVLAMLLVVDWKVARIFLSVLEALLALYRGVALQEHVEGQLFRYCVTARKVTGLHEAVE
jgi:hypothetical protein